MEYQKGDICGIENCKSRIYYLDEGKLFCRNGHEKQGFVQSQRDEDDFGTQGRTTRKEKVVREKVSRIYTGGKALELYLQCYQLILRKQCYAFIHTKAFPEKLEEVVRDLWALRLRLLRERLEENQETEDGGSRVFSSQVEDEGSTDESDGDSRTGGGKKRRGKRAFKETPSLLDSLPLCYMAMILLRLPASVGDIHNWAIREEIPYIRAIRLVPRKMRDRLPAHYIGSLDTQSVLHRDDLHKAIRDMITLYDECFELKLPPLNHFFLLFRYAHELALPVEINEAVRRVSSLLAFDFAFPISRGRQHMSAMPEIRLICVLVITVKLYYPFDSLIRHVNQPNRAGALAINWTAWCEAQTVYDARSTAGGILERGTEILVEEKDVMRMSGKQLDQYLDWYEDTWIDKESPERDPLMRNQQLLDMFPTNRLDGTIPRTLFSQDSSISDNAAMDAKIYSMKSSLVLRGIFSEEDNSNDKTPVRRIGSFYKQYRKESDLVPAARLFYETAAKMTGVSLTTLVRAVFQIEQKLHRRRAEHLKMEMTEEASKDLGEKQVDESRSLDESEDSSIRSTATEHDETNNSSN